MPADALLPSAAAASAADLGVTLPEPPACLCCAASPAAACVPASCCTCTKLVLPLRPLLPSLLLKLLLLVYLSASVLLIGPSAAAVSDSRDLASEFLTEPSQLSRLLLLLKLAASVGDPGSFSGSPSACRRSLFTAGAAVSELLLVLLAAHHRQGQARVDSHSEGSRTDTVCSTL